MEGFLAPLIPKRFNPRPPLPRGDAVKPLRCNHIDVIVSIHAPRCRGATHDGAGKPAGPRRVSIHAPRCRGATRAGAQGTNRGSFVSIHAPRCRGATPMYNKVTLQTRKFQSTPPVAEGRRHSRFSCRSTYVRFNPRPPLPRGDAPLVADEVVGPMVSIHAPRCRGATLIFRNLRKKTNNLPALRGPGFLSEK